MNPVLQLLVGAWGQTKQIRTLIQAQAVIEAEWAEKMDGEWAIAGNDGHRPATPRETILLDKVNTN